MAITTYAGLQTAIANWLMRTDLTDVIPDFIALCESRIARTLRVAQMEQTSYAYLIDGSVQLPVDFIEARRIIGAGAYDRPLEYASPGFGGDEYSGWYAGSPRQYTIVGNILTTYPNGGDGQVTMIYYAKPPALSDDVTSNWLLLKAPELYLYGSLMESAPYLGDDQRIQVWGAMFEKALMDLQAIDERSRYGNSVTRLRGVTP
jgi:hypothetical protein